MFIRINTLRINCDAIVSYRPLPNDGLAVNYINNKCDEIRLEDGTQMVKVLKKLDELFEIKENIASRLPKKG